MPSLKLSNPFRRGADRPSLCERAAALKATAGRVMRRGARTAAGEVAAMAPHHPGMVPYPAAAPTSLVAVDLVIRMEAARLLELADAEFDRRYDELSELDEAAREKAADALQRELRIRALAEAADDADPRPPVDWRNPPAGYMAHPAIEPQGFVNIRHGLRLGAERLHGIALAEFERRREACRPDVVGPTEADWSTSLRRVLRLDALAAAAFPERAEPTGESADPNITLVRDILAGWSAGADLDRPDRPGSEAEAEALMARRTELIDAAERLPATLASLPAKALALAWIEYADLWEAGRARDDYAWDGRLALDIHEAAVSSGADVFHPDAALLALGLELDAAEARAQVGDADAESASDDAARCEASARTEAACAEIWDILDRLATEPAHTAEGLRIKLKAVRHGMVAVDGEDAASRVFRSLIRDAGVPEAEIGAKG